MNSEPTTPSRLPAALFAKHGRDRWQRRRSQLQVFWLVSLTIFCPIIGQVGSTGPTDGPVATAIEAMQDTIEVIRHINWDMVQGLVQVFGFGGVVWGLVENRRALQTQVAMEFYRRFAEISARMPNEFRLMAYGAKTYADLPEATRVEGVRSMIDYLNLSSEEFSLYTKGRLPTDTWEVTAAELQRNFTRSLWRDVWGQVRDEYTSHKAFLAYMDNLISKTSGISQVD